MMAIHGVPEDWIADPDSHHIDLVELFRDLD
jgi:hypothetical protein